MGSENSTNHTNGKHSHSEGCNGTITCKECLEVLHMVIDHEQEPSETFKQHLRDCLPCLEKYNLDKTIKEILHEKRNYKTLPDGLVENIKARIINNVKG